MKCNMKEHVWVERYRPTTIDECILPQRIKTQLKEIAKADRIPNLLMSGGPGIGKTTGARALCHEVKVDWIIINCSEETGIDVLRSKITEFASTVSLGDNGKCIILDEFDYASPNLQAGLRNAIEAFSKTCSFILTCNYPNRIIPALHSRTAPVSFDIPKAEMPKLQAGLFKRIQDILQNENVKYDQKAVATVVQKFFPDNRRILNQLQEYARGGEIDEGVLLDLNSIETETLIDSIKKKSFKEIRQWSAENSQNDLSTMYTKLYHNLIPRLEGNSIPEAIMIINDFMRNDSLAIDKEIHCTALCVQLMMAITFK